VGTRGSFPRFPKANDLSYLGLDFLHQSSEKILAIAGAASRASRRALNDASFMLNDSAFVSTFGLTDNLRELRYSMRCAHGVQETCNMHQRVQPSDVRTGPNPGIRRAQPLRRDAVAGVLARTTSIDKPSFGGKECRR
jgi:hypothetical protein